MTVHSFHPDTHTEGLADGCERCTEHAEDPFASLDDNNLRALLERIETSQYPRSTNEAIAMIKVQRSLAISEKIQRLRTSNVL